jgi:hypothetical protein
MSQHVNTTIAVISSPAAPRLVLAKKPRLIWTLLPDPRQGAWRRQNSGWKFFAFPQEHDDESPQRVPRMRSAYLLCLFFSKESKPRNRAPQERFQVDPGFLGLVRQDAGHQFRHRTKN